MIEITLKGNGLRPLNLNWWKPTQKQWAPVLLKDHRTPWTQESDPTTGRPWARLTPPYASWKSKNYPGQPILRLTGEMQDNAKILPWQDGFKVKSRFYGVYHQFGTSKMAARPWMGIPDKSLEQIVPISWKNILSRPK
jgi:hypothetical protein